MTPLSLQDGIDQAGSPVDLLWKPNAGPWTPEVIDKEYGGWRQEQAAWHEAVAIMDLSHHMSDTVFEGSDVTRLLAAVSANNYESFAVGQAKQFMPVAADGNLITDGILLREAPERYVLSGIGAAQNWVKYHAEAGGYDVTFSTDPSSAVRGGADPRIFRYQVQGPQAADLVSRAFGGPLPDTKFFHSTLVTLAGAEIRALRHGMAGQAGYEFIGDWTDAAAVKDALMSAGDGLGLLHVGALSYPTAGLESGWIPSPLPAIYTAPELTDYRRQVSLFSYEGQNALHGSFFSPRIEDYYVSPFELGYGRSLHFGHDFIGRDALLAAREGPLRTKVTLVFDPSVLREMLAPSQFGAEGGDDFLLSYARYRIESGSALAGTTYYAGSVEPVGAGAVLALGLVDPEFATPGSEVTVVWGEHPGGDPAAAFEVVRVPALVQPAPYDQFARSQYRSNTAGTRDA